MAQHNISGEKAESKVAEYLKNNGYRVIGTNWRTKWCEIDIIASRDKRMHFVEVKYRGSGAQGDGLDYITRAKLRKMELAARSWVEINSWEGEYILSAAEVSGSAFEVRFIEEI